MIFYTMLPDSHFYPADMEVTTVFLWTILQVNASCIIQTRCHNKWLLQTASQAMILDIIGFLACGSVKDGAVFRAAQLLSSVKLHWPLGKQAKTEINLAKILALFPETCRDAGFLIEISQSSLDSLHTRLAWDRRKQYHVISNCFTMGQVYS